ncbi:MAG: hypothetical protein KAT77_03525 [Nanoarchaeota archaeon]|nr:hypothetical protein [Nanoarchaeota archaeon]
MAYVRFTATSSVLGEKVVPTTDFVGKSFYREGQWITKTRDQIFKTTGIDERVWSVEEETDFDLGFKAEAQLIRETGSSPDCIIYCYNGKQSNGKYSPIPAEAAMLQDAVGQAGKNLAVDVIVDSDNEKDWREGLESKYPIISYLWGGDFGEIGSPDDFDGLSKSKVKSESDLILVNHQGNLTDKSIAWEIKKELDIEADTYVIIAGCAGWGVGCDFANELIKKGIYNKIDVVGIDLLNKISDSDNLDSTLYGSGGGATRLEISDQPGIIDSQFYTDGSGWAKLRLDRSLRDEIDKIPKDPARGLFLRMDGNDIYQWATEAFPASLNELLERNDFEINDLDALIFHQMNGRMIHYVAGKVFGMKKKEAIDKFVPLIVHKYGNFSTGSIPVVLDELLRGELKRHYFGEDFGIRIGSEKLAGLVTGGAGKTWGSMLVRF